MDCGSGQIIDSQGEQIADNKWKAEEGLKIIGADSG